MVQQFANDDLFDAELGEDSDGGQNGDCSDELEESAPKSPAADWIDKEKEDSSGGEAVNSGSGEEATPEKKKTQRRREARKKVNELQSASSLVKKKRYISFIISWRSCNILH